ncbi:MAG: hypothetical protein Q7S40_20455, partial [Opitutaceae bacterium]|nr:hypothetical protein [Opitutaceae bacterium]
LHRGNGGDLLKDLLFVGLAHNMSRILGTSAQKNKRRFPSSRILSHARWAGLHSAPENGP